MSQQDILDFLSKNKNKWFISREIAEILKFSHIRVINNLSKIRKSKFVLFRVGQRGQYKLYEYKYKRNR